MSFDSEAVRASLRPLVPGEPTVFTAGEERYLRFYGIHYSEGIADLRHSFGVVETDTHTISVHHWRPANSTGTAVVLHGYYDHVGLYGHLIQYLLDRGLGVLSFDLPGHGLSSGTAASIETFDHYVAAFDACLDVLGEHLDQPWDLFGQSAGGAIAMEWLLSRGLTVSNSPFKHVVLLAPLVRPASWQLVRLYYYLVRGFIKERPRTFSTNADNPEFIAFLRDADILQARTLPVQWVTAMISWMKRFENYPATDIAPLVVQGQSDQTVDWKYNMSVMERLFEPQVLYIPEARHHLVNESEAIRAQIFAVIDAELDR